MANYDINLQEILEEHAQFLEGELLKMISKKRIKGKNLLGASINSNVRTDDPDISGTHELSFLDDGRFVDMGAGRMRKIESAETNSALIQARDASTGRYVSQGRKPKKWYSKTAYGIVFGRLAPKLIIHMQDKTVNDLKQAVGQ